MKKKPMSHAEARQARVPEAWRPREKVKPIKDVPRPIKQDAPQRFSKAELEQMINKRHAQVRHAPAAPALETLNIEAGLPGCDAALRRAEIYIEGARARGVKAVTLIHGWGSSGKGGALRVFLRERLKYNVNVQELLCGEGARGYKALPEADAVLRAGNPGITVVILKPGKG